MMLPETIEQIIKQKFPDAEITVTGDGHHFEASIISSAFAGFSKLVQHQMVYEALNPYIKSGELHAISLKTNSKE